MKKPVIIDIPMKMQKFFGVKGKMLLPEIEMVEGLICLIPLGKIATIGTLANKMAKDFNTDVSCPMRTGNAVKKIIERFSSNSFDNSLPYWRVVKKNKEIINSNYYELCASKLEDEGFKLSYPKSGKIKLNFEVTDLFVF